MTLKDARALRDEIQSYSYHSTVPLGHGPDGYFACIFGAFGKTIRFHDRASFRKHHAMRLRERRKSQRAYDRTIARQSIRPARSPLESMIDRACGLA